MALIVQKFGGTSVRTPESRQMVLNHVREARSQGHDLVVVVSAMGRMGDPYATDTLIDFLKTHGRKLSPKKKDLIMACGEIISAAVMASYLEAEGIPAEAMTGFQAGILTNDEFGNAEIIDVDPRPIKEQLAQGKVVVVAGFQGHTRNGEITTLGRGGSDTTAVELGGYLKADLVEIYTDVPGVAITDPRIVAEAPFIEKISYEEMLDLAENGAKVIHPRAVKAAEKFGIPFVIKSTFDDKKGTLVGPEDSGLGISGIALQKDLALVFYYRQGGFEASEHEKIKALAAKGFRSDEPDVEAILLEQDKLSEAAILADDLKADMKTREGLAKISVVYRRQDEESTKALTEKLRSLISGANISIAASDYNSSSFFAVVPEELGNYAVRAIFDAFFSTGEAKSVGA